MATIAFSSYRSLWLQSRVDRVDWKKVFRERLTRARTERKLTKTALGRRVGVTHVSIFEFESGRKVPSVDTLIALAQALDVSLDWLCGLPSRPPLSQEPDA